MVYILLILSVFAGIALSYFFGKQKQIAQLLLVLSSGVLLGITVLEIFPEIFQRGSSHIGIWILAGVLLQLVLESLTKGFEHGHFHHKDDKKIFPFALLVGLFIHAFFEGIPLHEMGNSITPYLEGILVHNIPISFVMGVFLLQSHFNKKMGVVIILLFALASPLGMWLAEFLNPDYQIYFLAIVSGIFLHISSVIIFENDKSHKLDLKKIFFVLLGIGIAYTAHILH